MRMLVVALEVVLVLALGTAAHGEIVTWSGDVLVGGEVDNVDVTGQPITWTLQMDDGLVFQAGIFPDPIIVLTGQTMTVNVGGTVYAYSNNQPQAINGPFGNYSGGDGGSHSTPIDDDEMGPALDGESMCDYIARTGGVYSSDQIVPGATGSSFIASVVAFNGGANTVTQMLEGAIGQTITVTSDACGTSVPGPGFLTLLGLVGATTFSGLGAGRTRPRP